MPHNPDCRCPDCQFLLLCDECCRCVCPALCVTIAPSGGNCSCLAGETKLIGFNAETKCYTDTIYCEGLTVDVSICIEMIDGECWLCLSSSCLDLLDENRQCIKMFPWDPFGPTCDAPNVSFNVDFSGCGDPYCGSGTISVSCVDSFVPDCFGCDCIPRNICVTYWDDDNDCFETQTLSFNSFTQAWETEFLCGFEIIDLAIPLQADVTECSGPCEIWLESYALGYFKGSPGSVQDPNCPDLRVSWTIPREGQGDVEICMVAAPCKCDCPCCDDLEYVGEPDVVLTATIVAPYCPDIDGLSFEMRRQVSEECQVFTGGGYACGSPVNLTLRCRGCSGDTCENYRFEWVAGSFACEPTDGYVAPSGQCTCDPFRLEFDVPGLEPATEEEHPTYYTGGGGPDFPPLYQVYAPYVYAEPVYGYGYGAPDDCSCCPPGTSIKIIVTE